MQSISLTARFALAAFSLLCVGAAAATPPAEPGGYGQLTLGGIGSTCIKTGSKQVPIVCGAPVVHFKISTLMGDPLAVYGLSWKLHGVHIANGGGHQVKEGASQNYLAGAVPRAVWDAAQKIELSLYGAALVTGAVPAVALQFNTGASVKPGGAVSLNVPDGYNWDRFLVYPQPGAGLQWACPETRKYVEPADAKNLMRKGLQLQGLQVCPQTMVDVGPLERGIASFCAANPQHPALFCDKDRAEKQAGPGKDTAADPFAGLDQGKRTGKSAAADPFAALDQGKRAGSGSPSQDMSGAFAQAEAEGAARIERKRKFDAASQSCQQDIARQESCAKGTCEAEPAKEACIRSVSRRTTCEPGRSCYIFQTSECVEHGPNPAHAKWQACVRDAAATCAAQGKKITSLQACVDERFKP